MTHSPIRLFIADDEASVRAGFRQLFGCVGDMTVVGEASNGTEVLAAAGRRECEFDLLVLDLTMPGPSGIELVSRVRQIDPELPILALVTYVDPALVKRTLRAGATLCIRKDADSEVFLAAIRECSRMCSHGAVGRSVPASSVVG